MASLLDISLKKKKKSSTSIYHTPENILIGKIKKAFVEIFKYDTETAARNAESFRDLPNLADRSSLFLAGAFALIEVHIKKEIPLRLVEYQEAISIAILSFDAHQGNEIAKPEFIVHDGITFDGISNYEHSVDRITYRNLIFSKSKIPQNVKNANNPRTAEYLQKEMTLIEMSQELYRYVLLLLTNNIPAM